MGFDESENAAWHQPAARPGRRSGGRRSWAGVGDDDDGNEDADLFPTPIAPESAAEVSLGAERGENGGRTAKESKRPETTLDSNPASRSDEVLHNPVENEVSRMCGEHP